MNILHYSIGFSYYRGGGMAKYSTDLIKEQIKTGQNVGLMWPGSLKLLNKKTLIKKRKEFEGINNYEIINPLPISFLDGINKISLFQKSSDLYIWKKFFLKIKPDIFHLHTLRGLHLECLQALKELNIPIIYTSHDYFGLCPKGSLIFKEEICWEYDTCKNCSICNNKPLSYLKMYLLQSRFYLSIRKVKFMIWLKNKHKSKVEINDKEPSNQSNVNIASYKELQKYYFHFFEKVTAFHFNSSVAALIFSKSLGAIYGKTISITHSHICDNRIIKNYQDKLRITYLGPSQKHKGFPFLIKILDYLYDVGNKNFILQITVNVEQSKPYLKIIQNGYSYNDLDKIFGKTDVLVVPSLWYETFGFVVLEALSYGVPVFLSETVGAKDLLYNEVVGKIINNDENIWYDELKRIYDDRKILKEYNKNTFKIEIPVMEKHNIEILNLYKEFY